MKSKEKEKKFTRYTALVLIMVLIFTSIITKLFIVQIVHGEEYKEKANNSSIREIPEVAPRGNIVDRKGAVLATSKQSYELVYNATPDTEKVFFDTMTKVFKILDENGETQQDDFELKINPFRFEFRASDEETRKNQEIRFKRDRGLQDGKDGVINKLYPKKKEAELTDEQKAKVDEELLKISPEETFKKLVTDYKIDASKYDLATQRRYMLVKDKAKMQSFSGYKPVIVASNISQQTSAVFSQILYELPGIDVSIEPIRDYPNKDLGSAFLGYISKISSSDSKYQEKGYDTSSDYVGAAGIESVFENRLRGNKGGKIVKLNRSGRPIEELGSREAYPGQNLQLTIDMDVQKAAEGALNQVMQGLQKNPSNGDVYTANATRGAAIAVDVNTGAILALASNPGYDPNLFATPGKLTPELYTQYFQPDLTTFGKDYITRMGLLSKYPGKSMDEVLNILFPIDKSIPGNTTIRQDPHDIYPKPFYNYATQSLVPPGSTFKPMTAIAGLESGSITTGFSIVDNGTFDKGGGNITRFKVGGYGNVDIYKALAVSSNPYFMSVGKAIRDTHNNNDDILAQYAWKFGLGVQPNTDVKAATGIEIPENFGQVYNTWSAKEQYGRTYTWQTMERLKSGSTHSGATFAPVDLYDHDDDSESVKNAKNAIKDELKVTIKTGKYSEKKYTELVTNLVNADPQYKDKNVGKADISTIVKEIVYITYSDAYMQLRPIAGANLYDACIGQGMSYFTPLQLASYVSTIANGGHRYSMHLVDNIKDADGNVIEKIKPQIIEETGVSKQTIDTVREGMYRVNNAGEDGTAATIFAGFPIKTAGKTGSATYSNEQDMFGRTSSGVYIGFAPYENPQIAVAIMIFDGGHGSMIAPVAKAMYEAYFKDDPAMQGYKPQYDFSTK